MVYAIFSLHKFVQLNEYIQIPNIRLFVIFMDNEIGSKINLAANFTGPARSIQSFERNDCPVQGTYISW